MKRHPTQQILLAAAIAVWLVMSLIIWGYPDQPLSSHERRLLAQRPVLNDQTVLSGEFMPDFETYASDQLPGRFGLRTLKALTRYHLLRQKENQGIAITDGQAVKLEHELNQTSVDHAIERFQSLYERYLRSNDHAICFALIPDKLNFAAADLAYPAPDQGGLNRQLERQLNFATFIDLEDVLSLDDYYRTDPHWRQERLLPVAGRLAAGLGITGVLNGDWQINTLDRPFHGAYFGHSALPLQPDSLVYLASSATDAAQVRHVETGGTAPVYDLAKAAGEDPYDLFLSGASALLTITSPAARTDRELIIFRDSFASSLAPLLLDAYRTITLVDIRYIASDRIGDYLRFDQQDVLFLYSTAILNAAGTFR